MAKPVPDKRPDAEAGDPEGVGDNATTYEPTRPQVNRSRQQGAGVGQKDIDYQRDPTRAPSADQYGQ
jgi:hypothetical protein